MKTEHEADKAQEWTAIHEQNSDGWYVCSNGEPIIAWPFTGREAKAIADHHNASIAAEREKHKRAYLSSRQRMDALEQQLAAERELRERITLSWTLSKSDNQQLREQFIAAQQPLVQLLNTVERLANCNVTGCGTCSSIRNVVSSSRKLLAKVKEGK